MPDAVSCAFLGVTHPHAVAWADAIVRHPEASVQTAYDPDAQAAAAFADRYGIAVSASPAEALATAHAVIVDGRNDQAAAFAGLGIEADLPTFIEKTGARTADDLAAVADRAAERGVLTQMGYFMRYADSVAAAREAVRSGELGRISLARFHAEIPHRAWETMNRWFANGSNVRTPFMEAGCHMVDVIRFLLGEPRDVRATAVRHAGTLSPAEDALAATMRCGDAVVTIDFTAHGADPWNLAWSGELYGDVATHQFGITPSRRSHRDGEHAMTFTSAADLSDPEDVRTVMAAENEMLMDRGMHAFIEAVRGRAEVPVDAASGAATLRLIEWALADAEQSASTTTVRHQ